MTEQLPDQAALSREKIAAAADPHETPDAALRREKTEAAAKAEAGEVSTDE